MSDYRDDSTDTMVISDGTFSGISSISEDVLRVVDGFMFGLGVTVIDIIVISDEVTDSISHTSTDTIIIADEFTGILQACDTRSDSLEILDSTYSTLHVMAQDSFVIADELLAGSTQSLAIDRLLIADSVIDQRVVRAVASDSVKIKDWTSVVSSSLVTDNVVIGEQFTNRLSARDMVSDTLTIAAEPVGAVSSLLIDTIVIADSFIMQRHASELSSDNLSIVDRLLFNRQDIIDDSFGITDSASGALLAGNIATDSLRISDDATSKIIQRGVVTDVVRVADEVTSRLNAFINWHDVIVIEDRALSNGGYQGSAWTANVDSWAMSRYEPYNYNRLVVIDDVLYGESDDGIYRLDQEVAPVVATIKTGKMDLGRGSLTHPSQAYLEYELVGQASMTVHTTQKGIEQQYTYMLPSEVASDLTNGRFIFGRGLRGRHFSFDLTMVGTHGYINDLSVEHTPTSRRV